jgi:glycosyltransferase involved in cell wall biosynthesis
MSAALPSPCFVAPGAYNVLSGRGDLRRIGGAEVQVVTLARALHGMGCPVRLVTWDHGQPDGEEVGGIRVHSCYAPRSGLPIVRFFHPRWSGVNQACARAEASCYLQACADGLTGQVAMWCRRHNRPFVFIVMHDWDCMADLPHLATRRERILYRHGLRLADAVIAQTDRQRALLREHFQRESVVVAPCGGRADDALPLASFPDDGRFRVLWLGRIAHQKRIEWLLDLAETCPALQFDVVGGANADDEYAQRQLARTRGLANVVLHGAVPHGEVGRFYQQAHALVLTSHLEGFPSVFIEAWSWGLPTVTTVDVDGVIGQRRLGVVADDPAGMAAGLRRLFASREEWEACSRRAREHFERSHTPRATAAAVLEIIRALPSPRRSAPATLAASSSGGKG